MINVLIVEDSTVFAMGLKMTLEGSKDIALAAHVTTSGAAVAYLNSHPEVDVAVVDITLEQQTDGLTLLGILREAFPKVAALVLSHYKIPSYIIQSITYGARGYLAKDSEPSEIMEAILKAAAGDCVFFGETLPLKDITRLFGGEDRLQDRRPQNLSPKELEVLQLVTSINYLVLIGNTMDLHLLCLIVDLLILVVLLLDQLVVMIVHLRVVYLIL